MANKTANKPHEILRQWEGFIEGCDLNNAVVNDIIARSWQRCKDLKVDPFCNIILPVKATELRQKIADKMHLIEVARPFMKNIYNAIRGSGFQIVLSDEEGLLLEVMGDPNIIKRTRQVQLAPGGIWHERYKGTNAIGTAIAEDKPVQVHATEHFCKPNHFLTCSASPIHNPEGRLIGVLDVTGDSMFCNSHTLAMVISTTMAIEQELKRQRETTKSYFYLNIAEKVCDSQREGLLTLDKEGKVVHLNKMAERILGLTQSSQILGASFSDIAEAVNKSNRASVIDVTKTDTIKDKCGNEIGKTIHLREIQKETKSQSIPYSASFTFSDIVGSSEALKRAKTLAMKAALTDANVLITGESGTGKELIAHSIHNASSRRHGPFVPVHCAAIPESLLESELFGYEEGAFTGAKKGGQYGKFELAQGGTIFLDEISELSLLGQVKLLRILQTRRLQRLGGKTETMLDVRIISATNKDLFEEVKQGRFRKDLYYRLNVVPIKMPPLRNRLEDIEELTHHFIRKISAKLNLSDVKITDKCLQRLKGYRWQGNVRELENLIERALTLMDEDNVITEDLLLFEDCYGSEHCLQLDTTAKALDDVTLDIIKEAIKKNKGNISKTALQLGISRATIYRKLSALNND